MTNKAIYNGVRKFDNARDASDPVCAGTEILGFLVLIDPGSIKVTK